jgi:hypothetical protein
MSLRISGEQYNVLRILRGQRQSRKHVRIQERMLAKPVIRHD